MLNVITLVGRLVSDPELRKTQSGTAVGSFRIACDDRKGPNGEKQTLFMDCTVFANQADFLVKYFRKGSLIGTYGKLASRKYTDKNGIVRDAYSVLCDRIEFVEAKQEQPQPQPQQPQQETKPIFESNFQPDDGDLPW